MKKLWLSMMLMVALMAVSFANAAADLEVNTPAISAVKASMQSRHSQLSPFYSSGAVGLTQDGLVAVKDAASVPLKSRGSLNGLVQAENADRTKLYREIATANGHPEWQAEIQSTFASRWIGKAQSGWFYKKSGSWVKK